MTETTQLSPAEEVAFRRWAAENGITNYDHQDAHYDMRGFWKSTQGAAHPPGSVQHFPDTFKQHGHPSFSQESQYSKGPSDGGMWVGGDTYLAQPPMAVSHSPDMVQGLLALLGLRDQ